MKFIETLKLAVAAIWAHKLRSALTVLGIVIAGWASNNKYALVGGLRSAGQLISYEISMGMSTIPVLLLAGNVSLNTIINQQAWGGWNVVNLTVAFFIFMVAAFAETNRLPFDFAEAEAELVAGYHTEYSGMRFALFFMAEYINMVTVSAVATDLFLGGWHGPLLPESLGWIWFLLKVAALLFFYVWMRWTLPRYRYDQLMRLGWKVLIPVAIANVVVTGIVKVLF